MGSRAGAAFRPCAPERRAPPLPVALGIVVAQRSALPQRTMSDPPGPQRGSAKVGLQFCVWEVRDKTPGQAG